MRSKFLEFAPRLRIADATAVAESLGDVLCSNFIRIIEICDRPGHAERPVETPGREAESIDGVTEETEPLRPRPDRPTKRRRREGGVPGVRIQARPSTGLTLAGGRHGDC
jgi:hypothetical protein